MVSVPIRGFNDFNLKEAYEGEVLLPFPSPYGVLMILIKPHKKNGCRLNVSVPIRGFNDFNVLVTQQDRFAILVSVPIRGFNDFNHYVSIK